MADDETTSTAGPPPDGTDHERLGRVESAVERIETALARIVPGSHAEAEERTEARLDRGSDFQAMVAAEVERSQKAAAEHAAAEAAKAEEASVRERIARLEEKPPAAPRLRRTPWLGWGDGRG